MALFSIVSSVQSMVRKLVGAIYGSPSSSAADQVIKKDLERLKGTLRNIQAVLNDAEEREIVDASVKLWLKDLRRVACDAENILGEYQYEIRRAQIITSESAAETSLKGKHHDRPQVYKFTSVLLQLEIPQRIKSIMKRFEEISKDRKRLQLREEDGTRRRPMSYVPPQSSSHVDESGIFGREDDKEAVIQMLLSDKGSSNFSVISIVGMGGLGKTTLAQCVYKDPRICQFYNSMGWVCVSEDFDIQRLTREIIQSIAKQSCGLTQLDALQATLKEIVDRKKVLVVLDDVWNEEPSFWESLKLSFLSATTTRVLVTTTNESIAKMIQNVNNIYMYRLGFLPEDKCWLLFCHHAFSGQNPAEKDPNLVQVGRKIMHKCDGLPLAVKTLGSLLLQHYKTDEESWRILLESEIWELDGAKDHILPTLKLSYYRMPTHLKSCFLFTSLYPKDFKFEKHEVIKMWMAQGYILPRGKKRLEDIGSEYFDELKRRSLFLYVDSYERYVLRDIVHDLARHISKNEHHSVVLESEGKVCSLPSEVRHLFVRCQGGMTTLDVLLKNTRDLRTLIINARYEDNALLVNNHQFEKLVHLRVLQLNFQGLPNWIASFKHLRYLHSNLLHNYNVIDSSFLNHLYNMQTLLLGCDCNLVQFARNIRHLADLRHLDLQVDVSGSTCLLLPSALEVDLTRSYFMFSNLVEITLHTKCEWVSMLLFSQLPSLRCLRLMGEGIKNVGHENYCYCPLHPGSSDVRKSVITNNVGFPCLEELIFENMYMLKEWSGVTDRDFPCLRKLTIETCDKLRRLPMLPSSLQSLHISGCHSLKFLPVDRSPGVIRFPCLVEMVFEDLPALQEEWSGVSDGDFPCLHELTIKNCQKLQGFPMLPSSLRVLSMEKCSLTSLAGLHNLTSLKTLKLRGCPNLQISPEEGLPSKPQHVKIIDCVGLQEWCRQHQFEYIQQVD